MTHYSFYDEMFSVLSFAVVVDYLFGCFLVWVGKVVRVKGRHEGTWRRVVLGCMIGNTQRTNKRFLKPHNIDH